MKIVTIELSVAKCKEEVLEMLRDGVLTSRGVERPTADDFTSFGDLHDYCDANTLGFMCDNDASLGDERVQFVDADGIIPSDDSDAANDRWMTFCNTVSDIVDAWLKDGGHRCGCECERVHPSSGACAPGTTATQVMDETPVCVACAAILNTLYV